MSADGANRVKLYVILGSHACRTGMLLLEHKGIPYETRRIPTGTQRLLRLRGFPGGTVPAMVVDGRRVQGNREIARFVDDMRPDPPLYPADPALRREVEEAEAWSDEVFQMSARRIFFEESRRGLDGYVDRGNDGPLGPMLWDTDRRRRFGLRITRKAFNVNERTAPKLLAALPAQLDRIDAWIEQGVLGGESLYAADYAIAPGVALLMCRRDLRPDLEGRPAGALARRVVTDRRG